MRTSIGLFAVLAVFGIVGCSVSKGAAEDPAKPAVEAKGTSVEGKWRGKVEVNPAKKDDPAAKMAEGMAELFGDFLLEITGDTYRMIIMGIPTDGTIAVKGNVVTLTPTKIMGKTVEEFEKAQSKGGQPPNDAGKPMNGTLSPDAQSILVIDPKKPETQLVFKRDTTKPREIGASTVKPEEAAFVGAYKAEIDPANLKPDDKEMAEALVPTTSLELFHDNSFTMNMMMLMEGVWTAKDGKITLTLKKMNGVAEKPDSPNKPMKMTIKDGKLIPDPDAGAQAPFFFVKK